MEIEEKKEDQDLDLKSNQNESENKTLQDNENLQDTNEKKEKEDTIEEERKRRKIILFTMFKVGSTTITDSFRNYGYEVIKMHDKNEFPSELKDISLLITLVRKPLDIYISALFYNLTDPQYEYCFGTEEQVNQIIDIDILIQWFLKFEWTKYHWLNFLYYQSSILNVIGVNLLSKPYDFQKGKYL